MMFSALLLSTFLATSTAFAPQHSVGRSRTQLHSYLDSLNGAPALDFSQQQPASFGDIITDGGINDICAFNAASISIKNSIKSSGSITASEIHDRIAKANDVVALTRQHFPGALGSSEILRRVQGVLDEFAVENILLTQSGEYFCCS